MTLITRGLEAVVLISVPFSYIVNLPVLLIYASLRKLGVNPYQDLKNYFPVIPKPILTRCLRENFDFQSHYSS